MNILTQFNIQLSTLILNDKFSLKMYQPLSFIQLI